MRTEQVVIDVVAQLLDVDEAELSADRTLPSVEGWDSVNSLRVLVFLERELNVSLDYERFVAARTIGDLAEITADSSATVTGGRP